MNLAKSLDVFSPHDVKGRIHIIGCGSVGSTIAELLARYGLTNFTLYDFDTVEKKNIVNQMFFDPQVGQPKVEALRDILCAINPEAKNDIRLEPSGWNGQPLSGYVFLAVDNIEIRQKIVDANRFNTFIKAMFDVRTALFDAQLYAADWSDPNQVKEFRATMNFTHVEATAQVPVSACGTTLGVAPTVRVAACYTVTNFQNFIKKGELIHTGLSAPFNLQGESAFLGL